MNDRFSVVLTKSAKYDVADKKRYILERFKYREYAESFSASLRKDVESLDTFPSGFGKVGFLYRGYDIYMKPINDNLLFYVVDEEIKTVSVLRILQDGMDWQNIIRTWLADNE